MIIHIVPILSDNYSYILESNGMCAIIDPSDGPALMEALEQRNLTPSKILITHHHNDHIDGLLALKEKYKAQVYGPAAESSKITGLDHLLQDGDIITLGTEEIHVIATPGHTNGHIVFWAPDSRALFSADTLFSLGCGRLFEGSPQDMYESLERLKELPDDTLIYCGHEYTVSNALFSLSIKPDDATLLEKLDWIKRQRANSLPTIPTTLGEEKAINLFLQCENAEAFAALRRLKDTF